MDADCPTELSWTPGRPSCCSNDFRCQGIDNVACFFSRGKIRSVAMNMFSFSLSSGIHPPPRHSSDSASCTRQTFQERASEFWLVCDSLSDVIFVLDVVVQLRTGYLEQGLMVRTTDNRSCGFWIINHLLYLSNLHSPPMTLVWHGRIAGLW